MEITAEQKNELNQFLSLYGFNTISGNELTTEIVNQADQDRRNTPLIIAVQNNHTEIAELLVGSGANVNQANHAGSTPLSIAVQKDHDGIVRLLLNNGADVNQATYQTYMRVAQTPLSIAARRGGNTRITELLLTNGAEVNYINRHGETPLSLAARYGNTRITELLLTNGAEVNYINRLGETPLSLAARYGNTIITELLLTNGAEVNYINRLGETPLSLAARYGNTIITELLLTNGAEVNYINRLGETPLSLAARYGNTIITELLLTNGAEVNYINRLGETPLSLAAQNNHTAIVRTLLFATRLSNAEITNIDIGNLSTDPIIEKILACNPNIFANLRKNLNSISENMQNDSWRKEAYRITVGFLYKNFQGAVDLADFLQEFTEKTAPNKINNLISKGKNGFMDYISKRQNPLSNLPDGVTAEIAEYVGETSNLKSTKLQNELKRNFSEEVKQLTSRLNALHENYSTLPQNVERTDDGEYTYSVDPENGGAAMVERRLNELNSTQLRRLANSIEQREREVAAETTQDQSHAGRLAAQRNRDKQRGGGCCNIS